VEAATGFMPERYRQFILTNISELVKMTKLEA